MAPEQAKGRPVDKRADIWAFGVVLFEMLTGLRLFPGETTTEIIAAVIKDDLALDRLPPDVPPAIRRLLARCLERDPRQRLRDIGEARIVLADPASIAASTSAPPPEKPRGPRTSILGWTALALVLAGAAAAAAWWLKPLADLPLRRIELADPLTSASGVALAPDGSRIAYVAGAHLYVRALDALAPQDLGAVHVTAGLPFWSPDGHTIGFTTVGAISTVPASGGPVRQICKIPAAGRARCGVGGGRHNLLYRGPRQRLHRARVRRHARGLSRHFDGLRRSLAGPVQHPPRQRARRRRGHCR